jgi:hypothetical protein
MANRRNVKKDIEYVTYTIVHDCMAHLETGNDKSHDAVIKVVSEAVRFRNELFYKVNHQKAANRSVVRQYYRDIYKELFINADKSFDALSKAIKGK